MKINDINLMKITVTQNGEEIYSGEVNSAPEDIKKLECKKIVFEAGQMFITV